MSRMPFVCAIVLLAAAVVSAEEFEFHHENVIGTFAEFRVHADSRKAAQSAEAAVLYELDRLTRIYSTYDEESEVRRWMRSQGDVPVSPELFQLLKTSDEFRQDSRGAFNPTVADAGQLWREAAAEQRLPSDEALAQVAAKIQRPAWELAPRRTAARFLGDSPTCLSFDAIAKGLMIDKACDAALSIAGVRGVLVNIGGDLRIAGAAAEVVSIASPQDETSAIARLDLRNSAAATSGGCHKYFEIDGARYSHILDPRTARPVSHSTSVTVLADSAAAADAMATALSVLPVDEALAWCNRNQEFSCLIVDSSGDLYASENWPGELPQDRPQQHFVSTTASVGWPTGARLKIELELNQPTTARYRRPYIAVWIEDEDDLPVRTLILWLQEGRGARWHRDLKRWYKQDSIRRLVDGTKLIGTISSATRPPGRYKTVWNGEDDQGEHVPQGKYTLYIEAAREHGTYQLIRQALVIGDKSAKGTLEGNAEIKSASYEYTP